MVILTNKMALGTATEGFAALGSQARLEVLLALVRAGDDGLSVGTLQERTAIAASTLAHHLRALTTSGLIRQEKTGRTIINYAEYQHLESLAGFILKECCGDVVTKERKADD